ncbi:MAG TPA: hypothetical protein VM261_03735 [Kofleriaceae bacterium]|nr:hypothetical protein [Kofleriaceae bacterium]
MNRRSFVLLPIASMFAWVLLARPAEADLSKKVIAAFKGKILVTSGAIGMGPNDKDTIAHFKKAALTRVAGEQNGNDVQEWTFNYTAFLKNAAGVKSLKLEFYRGDTYAADQTLTEVDPKLTVVEGDVTINEDDGLTKGKTYTLKLVGTVKGKDVVLASAPNIMFD